ncbi:MAG: peptidoglycan DD-metalloendopeptidase family protein [Candidatus Yanofskybacteria bacterium]|nr:peptidoglycan DD-metalloendopeptidase family protein [Candidatus Yanofskybacteria bacterium]
MFLAIFLSSQLIFTKGSLSYGQDETYSIKDYIEEVAIPARILTKIQSAEANSLASFVGLESHGFLPNPVNTLQQTSLMAFNSLENNLSEFKSNGKGDQISIYTVQEGDTLSFIASDFGVSTNTIIWANSLKDIDSIRPGDELKIPPINGVVHKVKKGDTISSVAQKYAAEQEKIIEFNALPKDGSLQIDDELIIPDGKKASTGVASGSQSSARRFAYLPDLTDFFMLPAIGRNWGIIHGRNGVDIANSCGTPIYAAAGGVAAISDAVGWNGGFGKFIKLVHSNGTETIYAHASKLLVNQGQTVSKGEQVAIMGTTGRSTGCHLHFEVHGAKNPLAKY